MDLSQIEAYLTKAESNENFRKSVLLYLMALAERVPGLYLPAVGVGVECVGLTWNEGYNYGSVLLFYNGKVEAYFEIFTNEGAYTWHADYGSQYPIAENLADNLKTFTDGCADD